MSHDPHAHDAAPADAAHASHGPAEIPPAPKLRSITPAPEDYATPTPSRRLLWPVGWFVVAFLVWSAASAHGWHEAEGHDEHRPASRPGPHAPAHR